MKAHFDNVNMRAGTGPNTFANRLAKKLFELGHEVVFEAQDAAASLVFIEPSGAPLARKIIQRLDGIWFKPEDFQTKNVPIRLLYNRADAVVFQSQFDFAFIEKWWGDPAHKLNRPHHIIGNGVDVRPVTELTIPKLAEMRAAYDQIYVCSSNWHAQKRLEANVRLFNHLRTKHPNSCLIIMGNHPDYRATGPHVFYTGPVGPETYLQIYSAANWMLHLAWADHCPNVVVEALSQGTPVVCSEVGGTKELVGGYGVVLKEQPYNYELYDYDNPPPIDVEQVDDLPTRQQLNYAGIAEAIDINTVAKQYVQLFEEVCR
jgi:glycosyltransferase involved in cell wall biosynthesis